MRAPFVLLLLVSFLATACSSSDDPTGLASEPTEAILEQARASAKTAVAVHVSGTWVTQKIEYQIDMRIKTEGARGEIVTAGSKIELLRVAAELYVRGDEALYQPRDGRQDPEATESAKVLHDKFVKVPPNDPAFARLSGFTQLHPLLDELFRLSGKVKKDGRKNVRGIETLALAANKGRGGELYVSLAGKPYPMRYSPGPKAGRLDLYEYDQDFPIDLPAGDKIVDYGSLDPTAGGAPPGTDASRPPAPSGTGTPTATAKPSGTGKSTAEPPGTRTP